MVSNRKYQSKVIKRQYKVLPDTFTAELLIIFISLPYKGYRLQHNSQTDFIATDFYVINLLVLFACILWDSPLTHLC